MSPRAKAKSAAPRTARARATKAPAEAPAESAAPESTDVSPPPPRPARPAVALPPIEDLVRAAATARGQAPPEETEAPQPAPEPAAEPEADPEPIRARLATAEELEDWDARAVGSPNGHVYQSRAWADYRAAHGWHTWHLAFDDGFRLLVLGRPRSVTGGGSAYASRGPIPEANAELSAQRATVAADLLASDGMDELIVDGETPAGIGLGHLLAREGFELTEELQPSRHRMDVRLGPNDAPNSDEKTIFASFGADTRHRIRQTERHGLRVKRLDAGGGRADEDASTGLVEEFEAVDHDDAPTVDGMLRTFYGMLDATAERRGFVLASEDRFLDWARRSLAVGHMFYLQAEHPEDGPLAGATFYRHGHRLTYALAGDRAELRRTHPGAVRLLVWRAIQIALDENRSIVDLGGVDVEGARGRPNKGDPTYGMYEFKESFGARWVELTGAHRKTMRPMHGLAGRVLDKLATLRR